jgi:hypothetical protein
MKLRIPRIDGRICGAVLLALITGFVSPHRVTAETLAATPLGSAFTYQGLLLTSNAPTSSLQDFQFTLFDQSSGGIQIAGPITFDNVAVSNGVFSVQLDFGIAAFNGDNRFIAIGVRPGPSTGSFTLLSPRTQVTATPYALYALQAATVSGTVQCARRKFYMTSSFPQGNAALTACVAGYHMASLQEIMDPSNLKYATDLVATGQAHTLPDAGSGPPFSTLAFVRTGVSDPAAGNTVAGNANCNVWTTASTTEFGTVVALKPTWNDSPTHVSPWDAIAKACDNLSDATPPAGTTGARVHVWCVED